MSSNSLSIQCTGKDISLSERDFFESLGRQIAKGEKEIPWKNKKKYKVEVSKKAQDYVLRLIDVKADREIERLRLHSTKSLMDLETRLLTDLARSIEKYSLQAALDIQKDFKDAQTLAKQIDPDDDEFNEGYLKDIRNVALENVKNISRIQERNS